ncbi:MAG: hypothetical protein LBJ21_02135 [Acidobacteriota bacterium]|nr:hypothetical protein [Acidobacteriota bacterium]
MLFYVIYQMINPGGIIAMMGPASGPALGNAILGGIVYTIIFGYIVLRALRLFFTGAPEKLAGYMTVVLGFIGAIFVFVAFGICFKEMLDSMTALSAGNSGNEHLLGVSYVFLVFKFITDALPYGLNVLIVFAAINMLDEMRKDRYSDETVFAVSRMSGLCAVVLKVTVLLSIGFNILQMVFINSLMVVNVSINIPVFSIVFVLGALLLTQFASEGKRLREDNEMFI